MKNALMRGADLIGHPVVDLRNGEDVAEVRDVIFDPTDGRLSGFTLNKRGRWAGRLDTVLPIAGVSSVGSGAVMVDGFDPSAEPVDGPNDVEDAATADREVVDDLVVTESGRTLGTVIDVVILGGESPRVVAFEIDGGEVGGGFIPLTNNRGVSGSALVVPDEYEGRLRNDLTGLADQIDELGVQENS